jgi:hypothetical protein
MAMKFERLQVKRGKRLRQHGFFGFVDDVFFIAKAFRKVPSHLIKQQSSFASL